MTFLKKRRNLVKSKGQDEASRHIAASRETAFLETDERLLSPLCMPARGRFLIEVQDKSKKNFTVACRLAANRRFTTVTVVLGAATVDCYHLPQIGPCSGVTVITLPLSPGSQSQCREQPGAFRNLWFLAPPTDRCNHGSPEAQMES
jgi:hypothetical protein